jgi:hypothetical protein
MARPEVKYTEEFERVSELTRRHLTQADADAWAEVLTPECRTVGSPALLRAWQALAMAEVIENKGGFLCLPVGLGKTLLTHQIPRLMGLQRPVLIVPTSLEDKTRADFRSYMGVWKTPNPPPRIITIDDLKQEKSEQLLWSINPDGIFIDEADDLSNPDSSMVRKLDRFIVAHWDTCAVVTLTGTPSRKSLLNYWHLLCWTLKDNVPVPRVLSEAKMWAAALDDAGPRGDRTRRPGPGPLGQNLAQAREWFRKRLAETPGVVIVDGDSCTAPIRIRVRQAKEDPVIDALFEGFILKGERPDGELVSDSLSRWKMDGQLGSGFTQYYDPPPPDEWRMARRGLSRFVRSAIEASTYSGKPLDTEGAVIRAFRDTPVVEEWLEIKDTFDAAENTKVEWFSTSVLESCVDWLNESDEPGIIWTGSVEFAQALAMATRLAYFSRHGKDAKKRGLHSVTPATDRNMICSWHANKKGFNLQAWTRNLLHMPPQSAKWLEQIFGRTHRSGQDKTVTIDWLATSGGTLDAFESAISEARYAKSMVSLTQKILRAKITRATPRMTGTNRYRWAVRADGDDI